MEEEILLWEASFLISLVPARNYLFKVSNLSTRNKVWKLFNIKNVNVNDIQY